jgi:2-iminobutanoate/2-iminopropanoate deaminase
MAYIQAALWGQAKMHRRFHRRYSNCLIAERGIFMKTVFNVSEKPLLSDFCSTAVIHNGVVYLSGQICINPQSGELERGSFRDQAVRTFENIKLVLEELGSGLNEVLKCTVYLSSMKHFAEMNEIYHNYFAEQCPARVTVAVSELSEGLDIEVSVTAALKD